MSRLYLHTRKYNLLAVGILLLWLTVFTSCNHQEDKFTILCWPGYDEPEISSLIENELPGLNVSYILYTSGEDMIKKLRTNKNKIDLVVVDAEYGKVLNNNNELQLIGTNEIPNAIQIMNTEYIDVFKPLAGLPGYISDQQKFYCVIIRWGTVGMVAQKSLISNDSTSYNILFDQRFKKKISIFDWYLPNMGVFSLMYLHKNNKSKAPYDLTKDELAEMYSQIMVPLRQNVEGFYSDLGNVINKVNDTSIVAVPGIGEWAIGNTVLDNPEFNKDWTIPEEGGIMWIEALAIPKGITSSKRAQALKIIELFTKKEVQVELAWRKSYTSQVPNIEAYRLMNTQKQNILKFNQLDSIQSRLFFRQVPSDSLVNSWSSYWAKFKAL